MATPIRTLNTLIAQDVFGDIYLNSASFDKEESVINKGYLENYVSNNFNSFIENNLKDNMLPFMRDILREDENVVATIKEHASVADINDKVFITEFVNMLLSNDANALTTLNIVINDFIKSNDNTITALKNRIIKTVEEAPVTDYYRDFVYALLKDDATAKNHIKSHIIYMINNDNDFKTQFKSLFLLLANNDLDFYSALRSLFIKYVTIDSDSMNALKTFLIALLSADNDVKNTLIDTTSYIINHSSIIQNDIKNRVLTLLELDTDTIIKIRDNIINFITSDDDTRNSFKTFISYLVKSDKDTQKDLRELIIDFINNNDDIRFTLKNFVQSDPIFKDKLINLIDADVDTRNAIKNLIKSEKDIENFVVSVINKNALETSDLIEELKLNNDYNNHIANVANQQIDNLFVDSSTNKLYKLINTKITENNTFIDSSISTADNNNKTWTENLIDTKINTLSTNITTAYNNAIDTKLTNYNNNILIPAYTNAINNSIATASNDLTNNITTAYNTAIDNKIAANNLTTKINYDKAISDAISKYNTDVATPNINSLLELKVNISDVIDALDSTRKNAPLSANMGKSLNDKIDVLNTALNDKVSKTSFSEEVIELTTSINNNKTYIDNALNDLNATINTNLSTFSATTVKKSDIINDLYHNDDSDDTVLHAYQGYLLKQSIDNINTKLTGDIENIQTELANSSTQYATELTYGTVKIGSNINVNNGIISLSDASKTTKGIVSLSDNIDDDSSTVAATSKAVKIAYDKANNIFNLISGSVSEDLNTLEKISTAINDDANFAQTIYSALNNKVDKIENKSLSSNDFTNEYKTKLENIEENANKYIHPVGNGYNHIPSGGSNNQILRWDSEGNAVWDDENTYDIVTQFEDGLMDHEDKIKLDNIEENANNYSHPVGAGYRHIPSGGSAGQVLKWNGDGEAIWANDENTTYSNATQEIPGLMSADDKIKLDNIENNANNYSHPTGAGYNHIPSGGSVNQVLKWAGDGEAVWDNNYTHPSYTALTGNPTNNATPEFGESFTISQIKSDNTGHVSSMSDKTITIPNTTATTSEPGLMSADDKTKLNNITEETWEFTLDDGTTITKKILIYNN